MTAPTTREIRRWGQALGLPVPERGLWLPVGLLRRWDDDHPDRPVPRGMYVLDNHLGEADYVRRGGAANARSHEAKRGGAS